MLHALKRIATVSLLLSMTGSLSTAANLYVYSLSLGANPAYRAEYPYIIWSPGKIQGNPNGWVTADHLLAIQTDAPYSENGNSWYIQVFTDNTWAADARTVFHLPESPPNPSYVAQGPHTPKYDPPGGMAHTIVDYGTCQKLLPKAGLISIDGLERIPMIWRVFDGLPAGSTSKFIADAPPILEKAKPSGRLCDTAYKDCDFEDCSWSYFLDKGDARLEFPTPGTAWTNGTYYVVPMHHNGIRTVIRNDGKRFPPTLTVDGYVGYLYVAANFRHATRQVYQTTIFVELVQQ